MNPTAVLLVVLVCGIIPIEAYDYDYEDEKSK